MDKAISASAAVVHTGAAEGGMHSAGLKAALEAAMAAAEAALTA
jgi:hypothetical protein